MNNRFSKAYKEVYEIINYLPKEDYNKIPIEKIKFYIDNMDKNYEFEINPEIDLSEQNISKEANAIIVTLFQDYFATEKQKEKINEILELNERKIETEKKEKYNHDILFKINKDIEDIEQINNQETALIEYKNNFLVKIKNYILKLLH